MMLCFLTIMKRARETLLQLPHCQHFAKQLNVRKTVLYFDPLHTLALVKITL